MTPCIIESPYAGDVPANLAYLQRAIRWCLAHGMTPYASHQMLTSALDDLDPVQRAQGIAAGVAMARALVDAGAWHLVFIDRGVSRGMWEGLDASKYRRSHRVAVSLDGLAALRDGALYGLHSVSLRHGINPSTAYIYTHHPKTGAEFSDCLPLHDATADTWGTP